MSGGMTRRTFVRGVGLSPLALVAARVAFGDDGVASAGTVADGFLDPHQTEVVTAATARLIPGPTDDPLEESHPGAREANVTAYIAALLSAFDVDPPRVYAGGPASDRAGGERNDMADFLPLTSAQEQHFREQVLALRETYTAGIAALDAAAGGDFAAAPAEMQDQILIDNPDGFTDVLFTHAIEGFLGNPEYGGNRDGVGWTEVDFPGDTIPDGYSASEVTDSDGPDPIDQTTEVVANAVDLVRGAFGSD